MRFFIAAHTLTTFAGWLQITPLDPSKRNLVLDIDHTIMDTDVYNKACIATTTNPQSGVSVASAMNCMTVTLTPSHWARPGLHTLLHSAYPYYNIIYWSATGNTHVVSKLRALGVLDNPNNKWVAVLPLSLPWC